MTANHQRPVARTLATVGVDIGQMADPTAISVVRYRGTQAEARFLERLPLKTKYPDVARRVATVIYNLRQALELERSSRIPIDIVVLVDVTGIGRATFDLLKEALPPKLTVVAVTLTGGTEGSRKGYEWHVPKQDLVDNLRRYVEEGRLHVAQTSRELITLQSEMRTFLGTKASASTTTTGARSGAHDDLVIAVGLALLPVARPRRPSHQRRALIVADGAAVPRRLRMGLSPEQQRIQSALALQTAHERADEWNDRLHVQRIRPLDIPPGTIPGPR